MKQMEVKVRQDGRLSAILRLLIAYTVALAKPKSTVHPRESALRHMASPTVSFVAPLCPVAMRRQKEMLPHTSFAAVAIVSISEKKG